MVDLRAHYTPHTTHHTVHSTHSRTCISILHDVHDRRRAHTHTGVHYYVGIYICIITLHQEFVMKSTAKKRRKKEGVRSEESANGNERGSMTKEKETIARRTVIRIDLCFM